MSLTANHQNFKIVIVVISQDKGSASKLNGNICEFYSQSHRHCWSHSSLLPMFITGGNAQSQLCLQNQRCKPFPLKFMKPWILSKDAWDVQIPPPPKGLFFSCGICSGSCSLGLVYLLKKASRAQTSASRSDVLNMWLSPLRCKVAAASPGTASARQLRRRGKRKRKKVCASWVCPLLLAEQ